ncbi:MAG: aminotransferase class IV [Candidatus Eremiobacterota bacterium]
MGKVHPPGNPRRGVERASVAAPRLEEMWVRAGGRNVPAREATVCVMDHGFLYGDGVYETLRTYGGQPFRFEDHVARFRQSAAGVRIPFGYSDRQLLEELEALRSALPAGDHYLRMVLTRGVADLGYGLDPRQEPRLLILGGPFHDPPEWTWSRGLKAGVVSVRRTSVRALSPGYKTCNLLNARLGHLEALDRGWDEALMLNDQGNLTESSASNLFLVLPSGDLTTPDLSEGLLGGVTRAVLLELADREGIPARIEALPAGVLAQCSEAFLSSTTRAVGPIGELDGRDLPVPGPVTARLIRAFRDYAGGL